MWNKHTIDRFQDQRRIYNEGLMGIMYVLRCSRLNQDWTNAIDMIESNNIKRQTIALYYHEQRS